MLSAIRANKDQLTVPGGIDAFIQKGADTLSALEAANLEQERLKGLLKTTTAQVDTLQATMTDWQSQANTAVKLNLRNQKEKWVEFGIKAKQ
jgi:hypothetical protein